MSFDQDSYYDGADLDDGVSGSDLDTDPLSDQGTAHLLATRSFQVRKLPKTDLTPEGRAAKHGYSHREIATVGRWLSLLLDECPSPGDSESFWRSCQIVRWLADQRGSQEQLAARINVSQQWVSKLVVKISERLSDISTT